MLPQLALVGSAFVGRDVGASGGGAVDGGEGVGGGVAVGNGVAVGKGAAVGGDVAVATVSSGAAIGGREGDTVDQVGSAVAGAGEENAGTDVSSIIVGSNPPVSMSGVAVATGRATSAASPASFPCRSGSSQESQANPPPATRIIITPARAGHGSQRRLGRGGSIADAVTG